MRCILFTVLLFLCLLKSYSQTATNSKYQVLVEVNKEIKAQKLYTKVEIKSSFPNEDSSWIKSLENKLTKSIAARKGLKKGKYFASVSFIITNDSILSEVKCEKNPGFGICEDVVREIKRRNFRHSLNNPIKVREIRKTYE